MVINPFLDPYIMEVIPANGTSNGYGTLSGYNFGTSVAVVLLSVDEEVLVVYILLHIPKKTKKSHLYRSPTIFFSPSTSLMNKLCSSSQ
jgi:hypothetical protein